MQVVFVRRSCYGRGRASEAWTELTETEHHLLRSAFVQTGFLVAKDGSENHLIELHKTNFPAGTYSF
jgi:hypothetical protein